MTSAAQAFAIAKRAAPALGVRGWALVAAIGGLETHWGDYFLQPDGTPSNNWGAVTKGSGWTGPTFEHQDSRWTGTDNETYTTEFRVYPTPDAGAADLASLLRGRYKTALAAAERGDWHTASSELYRLGYYSGKGPAAKAIADHYAALVKQLRALGIPTGLIIAATGLELAFWTGLALLILFKRKHRT